MKLLLISDTHGCLDETKHIMQKHPDMDAYFHMGDVGFALNEIPEFHVVKGNHDRKKDLPCETIHHLKKRHILCIHGDRFDSEAIQEVMQYKTFHDEDLMDVLMEVFYQKLAAYAKKKGCDTVFFGHSHMQCFRNVNEVILVNPGSVFDGIPKPGYCIVTLEEKQFDVEMMALE